ncbi:helix-turn-helix domain-containing protein [Brevundimonas sp. R86498]|uniref:helix-turn-helix domain-containing protein n=1 Tax=Brevundimonas sp. R86498 TaxID=3093845 RepID=UPI0037C67BAE
MQPLRFDTSVLPEDDQFTGYASGIANFDMSRPGSGPFSARAMIWRVGSLVIAQLAADPAGYTRTAERVRADRIDHFYVNYHYRGRARVECSHTRSVAGPGSLLVLDMRQACRMAVERVDQISLAIPRPLLLDRLAGFDPHGLIAYGGLATVLGSTLRAVCTSLPRVGLSQTEAIERMIVDLVVDTLLEALRATEARSAREEELASRVKAYIDQHLGHALTVSTLCEALGISRSSLYRCFGDSGGIVRQIQTRRLKRIQALLCDPSETRSIAALARSTGFPDKTHFTRVFRKTFGMAPGEYRRIACEPERAEPSPASSGDSPDVFRAWLRDIN